MLPSGSSLIQSDRQTVWLEPDICQVDLFEAQRLVGDDPASAPLEALWSAAQLFRGELLNGLDLLENFRFHAWCVAEREATRMLHANILRGLASRTEDPEQALLHAYNYVTIHPLEESAQRHVIELLVRLGRPIDAEAQLQRFKQALTLELGVAPSDALKRLRRLILNGSSGVANQPPPRSNVTHEIILAGESRAEPARPSSDATMHQPVPFVGRVQELERLRSWLAAGDKKVALIQGDPGLGKTRLMDEFVRTSTDAQTQVLRLRAFAAESSRALGPWRDALSQDAADLTRILGVGRSEQGASLREQVFEELLQLVSRQRGGRPRVLVAVDDLQWLDEASTAFLHFLLRYKEDDGWRAVCTLRPEEEADNHAVSHFVDALHRDKACETISLPPLDADSVRRLCASFDSHIDAEDVMRQSGGNAFFVLEVAGALVRGESGLSEHARRAIEGRLRTLSEGAREILSWSAALGRSFHIDVLERVAHRDALTLMDAIGELEGRGVLAPRGAATYDFSHDLLRDTAYLGLSGPRRRLLHRSIARALDSWTKRQERTSAAELLRHAELGQEPPIARRAALEAARDALAIGAFGDACGLADRGIQHFVTPDEDEEPQVRLGLLKCRVQATSSLQRPHPLHVVNALDAAIVASTSSQERFEALYLQTVVRWDGGQNEGAKASTVVAEGVGRTAEPETAARLLAQASRCLIYLDREVARARELHHEADQTLTALGVDDVELHWSAGLLAQWDGDLEGKTLPLDGIAFELAGSFSVFASESVMLTSAEVYADAIWIGAHSVLAQDAVLIGGGVSIDALGSNGIYLPHAIVIGHVGGVTFSSASGPIMADDSTIQVWTSMQLWSFSALSLLRATLAILPGGGGSKNSVLDGAPTYLDDAVIYTAGTTFEVSDPMVGEATFLTEALGEIRGDGVDNDGDGQIDECDLDTDGDGTCDADDPCPADAANDADGDGLCADVDNCSDVWNRTQSDVDLDGIGDACEADQDNDGVDDDVDNCPLHANPGQADVDFDGIGDLCDADSDNDGVEDAFDVCPSTTAGEVVLVDGCSVDQACSCLASWKNHGSYVKCVVHVVDDLVIGELITQEEADALISAAATTSCGRQQ